MQIGRVCSLYTTYCTPHCTDSRPCDCSPGEQDTIESLHPHLSFTQDLLARTLAPLELYVVSELRAVAGGALQPSVTPYVEAVEMLQYCTSRAREPRESHGPLMIYFALPFMYFVIRIYISHLTSVSIGVSIAVHRVAYISGALYDVRSQIQVTKLLQSQCIMMALSKVTHTRCEVFFCTLPSNL